jgi:hypothetical protein
MSGRTVLAIVLGLVFAPTAYAAKGTLILEIERADGASCTASVEIRRAGGTSVVKALTATGGFGQADLDPGDYDVTATALNGDKGTKRIAVESGKTVTHEVTVRPPPPTGGSSAGTFKMTPVRTVPGKLSKKSRDYKIDGRVVLLREVDDATVEDGTFKFTGVDNGKYKIAVYSKRGKLLTTQFLTIEDDTKSLVVKVP